MNNAQIITHLSGVVYASGVVNGAWEMASLADGAIGFFEKDGTLIDSLIPVVTADEVYVALGRTTWGAVKSGMIDRQSLKYTKNVYVAPSIERKVYGDDGTTGNEIAFPTIVAGQQYGFEVTNLELPVEITNRVKEYVYTTITGDTSNIICAAIAALITADPNAIVTCTVVNGNDGFQFVGAAGVHYAVAPMYDMIGRGLLVEAADDNVINNVVEAVIDGEYYTGATLTAKYHVAPVLLVTRGGEGTGTSVQILAAEEEYSAQQGNTGINKNNNYSVPSRVVLGQTYTQYILTWTTPQTVVQRDSNYECMLMLAIPSGDAVAIAAVDTILAAL